MRTVGQILLAVVIIAHVAPAQTTVPGFGSLTPMAVDAGGPSFDLTVGGSGFVSGSVVRLGNTLLSTTYRNEGQLSAQVPAALVAISGGYAVHVTNPGGATSTADGPFLQVR